MSEVVRVVAIMDGVYLGNKGQERGMDLGCGAGGWNRGWRVESERKE